MIYNAQNIINFRDLDGFKSRYGVTNGKRVFRCGIPKDPTEEDTALLKKLGIRTVIDLRGKDEASQATSLFENSSEFFYYNIPLLEANPALNDVRLPIWKMYALSLTEYADGYRDLFRLMGNLDEPFLCHCFLGKDRTGLVSALLLGAAGVYEDEIINDYTPSFDLIKPFIDREIENDTGLIWDQDISRLQSNASYIRDTLEYLRREHGGINGYLLKTGLAQAEINKAANNLFKENIL